MCNNKQKAKQQIHEQKTIEIGDLERKEKIKKFLTLNFQYIFQISKRKIKEAALGL